MASETAPANSARSLTGGDVFVFLSMLVVCTALCVGLMVQLGLNQAVSVSVAVGVLLFMGFSHSALRRTHAGTRVAHAETPEVVERPSNPRDRRPRLQTAPASKEAPKADVKPPKLPASNPELPAAAEAEQKQDSPQAAAQPAKTTAEPQYDLGLYQPKQAATDEAPPAEPPELPAMQPPANIDIDSVIKRLAEDILAGRKSAGKDIQTADVEAEDFEIAAQLSPPPAYAVTEEAQLLEPPPLPALGPPPLPAEPASDAATKLAAISDALANEELDVYLETINGLDDDRARHYEVTVRLRLGDGSSVGSEEYTSVTRGTGILPLLEAVKVSNTRRIALQMMRRGRAGEFFSAIDGEALSSQQFGEDVEIITGGDQAVTSRLVLAFAQSDVRGFSTAQWRALDDLLNLGFRFSIVDITDLDMDFEHLATSGFTFAKLDVDVMRIGLPMETGVVPASDICRHLAASGLTLIVNQVEDERARAEILGFGALLGQGRLFGGPRPVKPAILQAQDERELRRQPA